MRSWGGILSNAHFIIAQRESDQNTMKLLSIFETVFNVTSETAATHIGQL